MVHGDSSDEAEAEEGRPEHPAQPHPLRGLALGGLRSRASAVMREVQGQLGISSVIVYKDQK